MKELTLQRISYCSYADDLDAYETQPNGDHQLDFEVKLTDAGGGSCFISWKSWDYGYCLGTSDTSFFNGPPKLETDMSDSPIWAGVVGNQVRVGHPNEQNHQIVVIRGPHDTVYCCSYDSDVVTVTRNEPNDLHAPLDEEYEREVERFVEITSPPPPPLFDRHLVAAARVAAVDRSRVVRVVARPVVGDSRRGHRVLRSGATPSPADRCAYELPATHPYGEHGRGGGASHRLAVFVMKATSPSAVPRCPTRPRVSMTDGRFPRAGRRCHPARARCSCRSIPRAW